jgi:hypothetical protein
MKRVVYFVLAFAFTLNVYSLNDFYYKSIALDETGQVIVSNNNLEVRIAILEGNVASYEETHSPVTANQLGIIVVEIGNGVNQTGDLSLITARADTRIKIEVRQAQGNWVLSEISHLFKGYTGIPYGAAVNGSSADGKAFTVNGDMKVTGVIDPVKVKFSDGTPSSYDPSVTNSYDIDYSGRNLKFKSDNSQNALYLGQDGNVAIGSTVTDNNYKLDVNGYSASYNQFSIIPLWQGGSDYVMNNMSGQDLSNCESALVPTLYHLNGDIDVRLVIMITSSTANTVNFQLRAHDGITQSWPITTGSQWTYGSTQTGFVMMSNWETWNAGTRAQEVHLFGWVSNGNANFISAYLIVRPHQP